MSSARNCAGEKAVIYLRHSPKPQSKRDMASIELQRTRCRGYCEMLKMEVVQEMAFPFRSARKIPFMKRGGAELLDLCKRTGARNLVIQRVDRAFRDTADGLTFVDILNKRKIRLHLADEAGVMANTATAAGKMFLTMRLAFAAYEPALTAERTRGALTGMIMDMKTVTPDTPYGLYIPQPEHRIEGSRKGKFHWQMDYCASEIRNLKYMKWASGTADMSWGEIATNMNERGAALGEDWLARGGRQWTRKSAMQVFARAKKTEWFDILMNWKKTRSEDARETEPEAGGVSTANDLADAVAGGGDVRGF
ncbi:MAG: recombinase family protein [Micavibrio sp.]|nr:recombinase family protein [Micavibrio sp.]